MHAHVIRAYHPQYPDPISLNRGDRVLLGRRDTEFPGWIWATSTSSNKSGWTPEAYLEIHQDQGIALRDYSARELGVRDGELVTVIAEVAGWALVETTGGERGWVPAGHLAQSVSGSDLPL